MSFILEAAADLTRIIFLRREPNANRNNNNNLVVSHLLFYRRRLVDGASVF